MTGSIKWRAGSRPADSRPLSSQVESPLIAFPAKAETQGCRASGFPWAPAFALGHAHIRALIRSYAVNAPLPLGERGQGVRGFARGSVLINQRLGEGLHLRAKGRVVRIQIEPRKDSWRAYARKPLTPAPLPQGERDFISLALNFAATRSVHALALSRGKKFSDGVSRVDRICSSRSAPARRLCDRCFHQTGRAPPACRPSSPVP